MLPPEDTLSSGQEALEVVTGCCDWLVLPKLYCVAVGTAVAVGRDVDVGAIVAVATGVAVDAVVAVARGVAVGAAVRCFAAGPAPFAVRFAALFDVLATDAGFVLVAGLVCGVALANGCAVAAAGATAAACAVGVAADAEVQTEATWVVVRAAEALDFPVC